MEEILASIRRIIESNDPVSGETFASDVDETDEGTPAGRGADVDFGYESVEFTAANDPGPATPPPAVAAGQVQQRPVTDTQPEGPRSVSLADLAARVRSASERTERPVQQTVSVSTATPSPRSPSPSPQEMPATRGESPLMTTRLAELRAPQLRPSISVEIQPAQAPVSRQPPVAPPHALVAQEPAEASQPQPLQASVAEEAPMIEPQRRDMPEIRLEMRREAPRGPSFDAIAMHLSADPQPEQSPGDDARSSAGTDLTALVSAATVEHVSRSFSDLAAAIDGQERRSLDEMAEDMLRPMLKDWLDDNLPTLVERLVREEIERVARGPRR